MWITAMQPATPPPAAPPPLPRTSVRTFLLWLVAVCLLPGMLGTSALYGYQYLEGFSHTRETAMVMVGLFALFVAGIALAWRIGSTIIDSFRALQGAASAMGAGQGVSAAPLAIREADEVARVIARTVNLMQERADTLRASEARFKDLADNIAQLAWMADQDGTIRWLNRRWYDYTGITPSQRAGEDWLSCQHPEHVTDVISKMRQRMDAGEPWEDTVGIRGRDGRYRWFLSHAFALRDRKGALVSWFGTHTDITDQLKAQEALKEADQRKDDFIAILAHELRNPLAPVRTAVEILRRVRDEEPRQQRAREVIDRQIGHMARLIDDLLDISRIARGKLNLQLERCDLAAVTRDTAEDYRDSVDASGLSLHVDVGGQPLWVEGDPVRLAQMVSNLLSNAIRFTEPGGAIEVRAESDADHGMVLVRVSDTGVGVAPEFMERLFDPFSQVSQGLARSKGGLGLGLALTKGLAHLHGGHITVHSEGQGRGATFTLTIPMAPAPEPGAPVSASSAEPPHKALRVLVIEDNQDAAQTLGDLLELAGHQVRLAFDGDSGVSLARVFVPDAVISDIGLPAPMDGFEVVRRLRLLPELAGTRLVALSGYADEATRKRCLSAGFDAHVAKPADLATLEAALLPK
jgi:PAS domain S-box-containing protein